MKEGSRSLVTSLVQRISKEWKKGKEKDTRPKRKKRKPRSE